MSNAHADVPARIVITGAGGFVGQRVVARLVAHGAAVVGLGRSAEPRDWPTAARWVRADIATASAYADALTNADCVIHLAALTGKARPEDFQRANVTATQTLLEAGAKAGVRRFVFVSSIAVTFADKRHYAYADSKIAAETLVRAAPIATTIVRPTMILGPGSAIEASLSRLARLPVAPIFGDGRRVVQPVDIDDVADLLAAIALTDRANGETIELGGPERYDLRSLYARLRGATKSPLVHLPLGLARWFLALVEKPLLPLLPLTAGQLASFANDGVAQQHPLVADVLQHQRAAPRRSTAPPASPPISPPDPASLEDEARRFIPYVAGATPSAYQVGKYVEFHSRRWLAPANAFDAWLTRWARGSDIALALADAYSGLLFRTSVVRQKLVLALGVAETTGSTATALDRSSGPGMAGYAKLMFGGFAAALTFAVALVVLLPMHLVLGRRSVG